MVSTNDVEEPKPSENADACPSGESAENVEDDELTNEQKLERAEKLLIEGKRALMAGTFADATDKLGESCSLFSTVYDQFAPECYEAHYNYGKSLLELARMEPGVFTNALQGDVIMEGEDDDEDEEANGEEVKNGDSKGEVTEAKPEQEPEQFGNPDELTEAERDEIRENVEEALEENKDAVESQSPQDSHTQALSNEKNGDTEEDGTDEAKDMEGMADTEEKEASIEGGQDPDEDAENVDHLQLAWEVLEIARSICNRQEKANVDSPEVAEEWVEKKVGVLMVLGEVSIEDENYKQALDDLQLALNIQYDISKPKRVDRRIAETYFQMGRASNLGLDFGQSAILYQKAHDVIKAAAEESERQLALVGDESAEEKARLEKEVSELKGLLPDMLAKVEDARESAKNAAAAKAEEEKLKEQQGQHVQTELGASDSDAPATDISALVRKPVKRSGEFETEMDDNKRRKEDEVDEGHANGHQQDAQVEKEANGDAAPAPVTGEA